MLCNNSLDRTYIIIETLLNVSVAIFSFWRTFISPVHFPVGFPNERAASPPQWHFTLLTGSSSCHFTHKMSPATPTRSATRSLRKCHTFVSKSLPSQPMSFRIFRAHYASVRVYFQARLHTFCGGMLPAWCTLYLRGNKK